ncbi:hypothetical protein GGF32_008794 [Allomyces javanicus]|nr:hypothetical protein GGF32_008794 [Allomyces javanicus]
MRILLPITSSASSIRRPPLAHYYPPAVDELYACVWQLPDPRQQVQWANFFASVSDTPLRALYIKVDAIMKTDLNLNLLLSKLPWLEDLALKFGGKGGDPPRNNLRRLSLFLNAKYAALYPLMAAPFPELVHVRVDERVAAHPQPLTHLMCASHVMSVELVLHTMERVSMPHVFAAIFHHAQWLVILRVTFPSNANVRLMVATVSNMAPSARDYSKSWKYSDILGPNYVDWELLFSPRGEPSREEVETDAMGS